MENGGQKVELLLKVFTFTLILLIQDILAMADLLLSWLEITPHFVKCNAPGVFNRSNTAFPFRYIGLLVSGLYDLFFCHFYYTPGIQSMSRDT